MIFVNYGISVPAQNGGEGFPPGSDPDEVRWWCHGYDVFLPEEAFVDMGVGGWVVGKKLIKREWLLIGGVGMWGFEHFDDERAIKTKCVPAPMYVLVLTTYLNQEKSRQTQLENHSPPSPGSTTPGNRSKHLKKKREKNGWAL